MSLWSGSDMAWLAVMLRLREPPYSSCFCVLVPPFFLLVPKWEPFKDLVGIAWRKLAGAFRDCISALSWAL